MDRYIVVSSDCHAGLPIRQYRDYLDPKYRETLDHAAAIEIDMANKAAESFLIKDINEQWRKGNEEILTGAWDHDQRIKMLDSEGIAVEVVFPDGITEVNMPPFGAGISLGTGSEIVPELQWAGARAHNRWLAELCAQSPARHIGVAIVPLVWDIDEAVEEARWAKANGLRGVVIPNMTRNHAGYNHLRYHPFWAACQDMGLVIHFHSGAGPMEQFFGPEWPAKPADDHVGAMGAYVSEVMWWTYRPLNFLIWGGVFEKFPQLKVAITEAGTGWMVPPWLRLLDHFYHDVQFSAKMGDFKAHLSIQPSDYFRRNVAIGASCMPRSDAEMRHELGLDQIMWGSDFPHPEGSWPHTHEQMVTSFSGLPEADIAQMLGENAIRFYGLDHAVVANIAARIGPAKADFAVP